MVLYRCTLLAILSVLLRCAEREVSIPSDEIGGLAKSFVRPNFAVMLWNALSSIQTTDIHNFGRNAIQKMFGVVLLWNPPLAVFVGRDPVVDAGVSIDIESVPWTAELAGMGEYAFNYPGQLNQVLHQGI